MTSATTELPPGTLRRRALADRRAELKGVLLRLAARTTGPGTLTALARKVNRSNEQVSRWIKEGEVPATAAGELLRLPNANPEGAERIDLKDLTPSLF